MVCEFCRAEVDADSKYCYRCGQKLGEVGITTKMLTNYLHRKMESLSEAGARQYYQELIEDLNESRMSEVEIQKSSLEDVDLSHLITEEDGKLRIRCEEPEEFLQLAAAVLINESDCRVNEVMGVVETIHDDRMALLETAFTQYSRALAMRDDARRARELDKAYDNCLEGIDKLKKEIQSNLAFFEKLPKSTLKKLFSGISRQEAETRLRQMQESFPWYCGSIKLLMGIDMQNKEQESFLEIIEREKSFLESIKNSNGFTRLLEVDDGNIAKWRENMGNARIDIYCAERFISENIVTVKIVEEKNE